MLQSLREETEGKLLILVSPRKSSLDSIFEVNWGFQGVALLAFSLLISEGSWVFLSFLRDRNIFVPSDTCAESIATAGKIKKK